MPSEEETSPLLHSYPKSLRQRLASNWDAFTDFALRDNVLEVAVGLILASAFTAVVNSFVTDILLPVISLFPFLSRNLDQKFLVLKYPEDHRDGSWSGYNTIEQALKSGAVVWAWGSFVDKCMRLFVVALSLFAVGRIYGAVSGDKVIKRQVKCKYCRKWISEKVSVWSIHVKGKRFVVLLCGGCADLNDYLGKTMCQLHELAGHLEE